MAVSLVQAIVLDVNENSWVDSEPANSTIQSTMQSLSLEMVWVSVQAFMRALQLEGIHCLLYFSCATAAGRLFPLGNESGFSSDLLLQRLERRMSEKGKGGIWKAVSQVLCYVNGRSSTRILVIQHTEDRALQNEAMCAIGAAKKCDAMIDGISMGDCPVLEQATSLTGGVLLRHNSNGLLQILLQVYLPTCRHLLAQPLPKPVLLWPTCVCHGNSLNQAFACSACLALYCAKTEDVCKVCGTRFLLSS